MRLNIGCKMTIDTQGTAPLVLLLRPQSGAGQQVVASDVTIDPPAPITEFTDGFGNLSQRATLVQGRTFITATATVDVPDLVDVAPGAPFTPVQELPDLVLPYLLPSRYCQADLFLKLASKIVGGAAPGYDQAEAIRIWIHRKLRYKYNVSNASTSAVETERKRAGVCRDFSHLGIALCRALRIPARMVSGYLHALDPMDLHAWYEAFVGGRWYTFDATQPTTQGNRVVVAYGRDAADTAQLSEYGPMQIPEQSVWVNPA